MTLGFIGTGVLAAAVVDGLCAAWNDTHDIVVSPRSQTTSTALAARHPAVRRTTSNQAVVDASGMVFVGVLPPQLRPVLAALAFRADQTVVSFVGGAGPDVLRDAVGPGPTLCQMIPLPMIAHRRGPILMHPAPPAVCELFAPLGTLVHAESAEQMATQCMAAASLTSLMGLAADLVDWLTSRQVPPTAARDYVMALLSATGEHGLTTAPDALRRVAASHETPGGLSAHCRTTLDQAGWFAQWRAAIESTEAHATRLAD